MLRSESRARDGRRKFISFCLQNSSLLNAYFGSELVLYYHNTFPPFPIQFKKALPFTLSASFLSCKIYCPPYVTQSCTLFYTPYFPILPPCNHTYRFSRSSFDREKSILLKAEHRSRTPPSPPPQKKKKKEKRKRKVLLRPTSKTFFSLMK